MFGDHRHFRRLQSQAEQTPPNVLADRLRTLTDAGLVTRDNAGRRAADSRAEPAISELLTGHHATE